MIKPGSFPAFSSHPGHALLLLTPDDDTEIEGFMANIHMSHWDNDNFFSKHIYATPDQDKSMCNC